MIWQQKLELASLAVKVGGVAMSCCPESSLIRPENAAPGDVIVLTKPLGTQVAVNAYQWLHQPEKWSVVASKCSVSREDVKIAYVAACESMSRLNRNGAILMHKYGSHGATDVTGFGLLRHANNLARNQKRKDLIFRIKCLPILKNMVSIDSIDPRRFQLQKGLAAETSGGLLVLLPSQEAAEAFVLDLTKSDGQHAWVVGEVQLGKECQDQSCAVVDEQFNIKEV